MGVFSGIRSVYQASKKWTWHHACVFFITFILYAVYHAARKSFSNVKNKMAKSLSPMNASMFPYNTWQREHMFETTFDANVFFGELDLLFMFAYAVGQFTSGVVGDRINLRVMLGVGMLGSSMLTFLFGYLYVPLDIQNKMYFRCLILLNGFFQSTGWPATVAVVGNWFDKSASGLIFGIWSSNANVGNVLGSLLVTSVMDFGHEFGMLLNSVLSFCMSVVVFICLIPNPKDVGCDTGRTEIASGEESGNGEDETGEKSDVHVSKSHTEEDIIPEKLYNDEIQPIIPNTKNKESLTNSDDRNQSDKISVTLLPADTSNSNANVNSKAISICEACLLPGVILYALSFACLKLVTYAFFFWLPTYLSQRVHWHDKVSDKLSNFYEIGAIVGTIFSGIVSDILGFRAPVVSTMLFLSVGSLYVYDTYSDVYGINITLMVCTGVLLSGPANLICTVICADLGRHERIAQNTHALATVTGIINGTGSFGAALGQYVVGIISKYYGWSWVFRFFIVMISMSFCLILPILVTELKKLCKSKRNSSIE